MTEKNEFSVDIDINPVPGFKPLPDLIAFDLCKPYAMPGGNLLLHNTRNGRRAVVKPEVYATLGQFFNKRLLFRSVAMISRHLRHM